MPIRNKPWSQFDEKFMI